MENRVNWLHITDLHYGQKGQNILLPKIKHEFFKDIEYIIDQIGKIDVVFFTGDLVMSGKKDEFDELTIFLKELWGLFKKLQCSPLLIAIPGNHDLERPDSTRAATKVLKNYNNDEDLKQDLWKDFERKGEYYDLISQSFYNFNEWYQKVELPKPEIKVGIVPGDISTTLSINGIKINVIGLNTAFLELSNDDYLGKLAINPLQLIELVGSDYVAWRRQADVNLLLTHHDPKWYNKESSGYYNNEINPSDAYYNHLCGHLHEADSHFYGIFGSKQRRLQLAPSLFGLQKIDGKMDRIHGYYAGSYIKSNYSLREIFYPRIANLKYNGEYNIIADNGFELNKEQYIEHTKALEETIDISPDTITDTNFSSNPDIGHISLISKNQDNIFDSSGESSQRIELDSIPTSNYIYSSSHSAIRLVEQQKLTEIIQTGQIAWVVTDWGLGENSFIGSVLKVLDINSSENNFNVNCEDISTVIELLEAINKQFSMTLQQFCSGVQSLEKPILTFNHLNPILYSTENSYKAFKEFVRAISDFCPQILIILITRQASIHENQDIVVKLTALDTPQIRRYIEFHSEKSEDLLSQDSLLKIEEITGGLPIHIDKLFQRLQVTTLGELIEVERESLIAPRVDDIPKALVDSINSISNSSDKLKRRSIDLLKILTILSHGETLANIKRFNPNYPIYPDNATDLQSLSLLEVITINKVLSKDIGNDSQPIKILRIPRQIRDYVNSLITESERDEILKAASTLYFGENWREGQIRNIYGNSMIKNNKFFNVDNCHLLIISLVANAIRDEKEDDIKKATNIAFNFCRYCYEAGDYRNAIRSAEEVYYKLKQIEDNILKPKITKVYGEALRMVGEGDKSLNLLNEALVTGNEIFSNKEKSSIYIDLAHLYLKMSMKDKVLECAKEIKNNAKPKSAASIQAKYFSARATLTGDELISRLRRLESEANREGKYQLSNNIALAISDLSEDLKEREKKFNKVLQSQDDDYNKVRAVIRKSSDILANEDGQLADKDLILLNLSYTYLYGQRLAVLFDKCHVVLWMYCLKNNRIEDILNLYRHSSLVWRLVGKDDIEKEYYERISVLMKDNHIVSSTSITKINLDYYNRRKLEFES